MDRIKDALGLAESEAAKNGANPTSETLAGIRRPNMPWPPASPAQKQELAYPIRYNQTHVHEVDVRILEQQRILHEGSDESVIKSYKLLRTQILKKMQLNNWNSIGVMSARSGQGATLTAINLAISVALEYRYTVMLADFNLRKPSIHRYFDYAPTAGISDFIVHNTAVETMLFSPGIESMVVLPGREAIDNSSERLTSPKVMELVADIKQRYASRMVIFDLPPLLESDDAVAFIDQFDAGLLVIEEGVTSKADLQSMGSLLGGKPILGTVLNNAAG